MDGGSVRGEREVGRETHLDKHTLSQIEVYKGSGRSRQYIRGVVVPERFQNYRSDLQRSGLNSVPALHSAVCPVCVCGMLRCVCVVCCVCVCVSGPLSVCVVCVRVCKPVNRFN